jgi:hypothetical protein
LNEDPVETSIGELYTKGKYRNSNVALELLKICEDNTYKIVKEVSIHDAYRVNIAFSPSGKYFALFRKRLNILQIFTIENGDIEALITKVHD